MAENKADILAMNKRAKSTAENIVRFKDSINEETIIDKIKDDMNYAYILGKLYGKSLALRTNLNDK